MKIFFVAAILPLVLIPAYSQRLPDIESAYQGRWDMVITMPDGSSSPRWMDYVQGRDPMVRVQPRGGSVHPAYDVDVNGSHMTLTVDKANGNHPATAWDLKIKNKVITGTQTTGDVVAQIKGVKAPPLLRDAPRSWTKPESIFDGHDLNGWEPVEANAKNNWVAENGELINKEHGANIKTTRKFDDFKLHIELNCPEDGNSGVYLRGRYEMQVEYQTKPEDPFHMMGSIYGFIKPTIDVPRKVGTWETFEITLVGRMVTIVRDGKKIIDDIEIPGITGGALDSNEGEPGPFYIQGDHTGGMKYRNITVQLPRE